MNQLGKDLNQHVTTWPHPIRRVNSVSPCLAEGSFAALWILLFRKSFKLWRMNILNDGPCCGMASNSIAASFFAGFGCRILWPDCCTAMQPLPRMHVILCQRIHYNSVIQGFCYLSTNVMWFYQVYIDSGLLGNSHIWFNVWTVLRAALTGQMSGRTLSECDDNAGQTLRSWRK